MSVNDCLRTVVGLSNNDCPCFETGRPEGYNTSLSGYYLDDPEFGFPIKIPSKLQDCDGTNLWDILDRARDAGITQFLTDFGAHMLDGYKRKAEPFNDWIGKQKGSLNLPASQLDTLVGLKINPIIFRGTIGKIFKLELHITGRNGDTIEVGIYDEAAMESGTPIEIVEIEIANNKGTFEFDETYIHDFMDDYSQKKILWLLYEPGAGLPRNNTIKCNCANPEPWKNFMTVRGVKGADTEEILDTDSYSGYTYGLRINMAVSCGSTWMCQNFDYENNDWARVMAECLMLYQVKKLAGIILGDPHPAKYTMATGPEQIAFYRDRANTLLRERMPWLAKHVPSVATDCFTCKNPISVNELMV